MTLQGDSAAEQWLTQSRFWKALHRLRSVLPQLTLPAPCLKGLGWIHEGVFALTLIALAFFDTGVIGGLIWAAGLMGLLYGIFSGAEESQQPPLTLIDVVITCFFGTALLATAFSSFKAPSLVGLFKLITFFVAYLNARWIVARSPGWIWGWLWIWIGLGLIESATGLYQYVNHVTPLSTWQDPDTNPELQLTRIFGTLQPSNPNLLAGFMIYSLAASLGLTLITAFSGRRKHQLLSIFLAGVTVLFVIILVLTGSRGGFLALAAMMGTMFLWVGHLLWHEPSLRPLKSLKMVWLLTLLSSVGSVLLGILAVPALQHRVVSIFAMREDSSNSFRLNVWTSVLAMIRDNWLVGIGPGNTTFKQVYGLYMVPGYSALSAYSIFLELWVEQGILGLVLFLLLWALLAFRAVAGLFSSASISHKLLLGTLLTAVVGSTVYGFFDTIWYRPSINTCFWCLVAALVWAGSPTTTPQSIGPLGPQGTAA